MTTKFLYIDSLDLSPYIADNNAGLTGLTLELEQDIWRVLHRNSFWARVYTQTAYLENFPTFVSSWRQPCWIFSCKYDSDGRCRLNLGKKEGYFYLKNLDNEWWQPKKQNRKPLRSHLQKRLF